VEEILLAVIAHLAIALIDLTFQVLRRKFASSMPSPA
jgi:hypothetical protein